MYTPDPLIAYTDSILVFNRSFNFGGGAAINFTFKKGVPYI